jgi:hypothetical protein
MVGIIAGVWVFAEAYAGLAGFVWSGELDALTLSDVAGMPFWGLAAALVVVTVVLALVLRRVEASGGKEGS